VAQMSHLMIMSPATAASGIRRRGAARLRPVSRAFVLGFCRGRNDHSQRRQEATGAAGSRVEGDYLPGLKCGCPSVLSPRAPAQNSAAQRSYSLAKSSGSYAMAPTRLSSSWMIFALSW